MRLHLRPQITQKLSLKHRLNQKMIQMLSLFQKPYADLVEEIKDIQKENVFIEVVQQDQLFDYSGTSPKTSNHGDTDDPNYENILQQRDVTLETFLLDQLELLYLSERDHGIIEFLIKHLDDRGFFTNYTQLKSDCCQKFNVKDRKVGEMLKLLQEFEPDGIGARSIKECLLIQVDHYHFQDPELESVIKQVIQKHLDSLTEKNYEKISKKEMIPVEGVEAVAEFIRQNLNPNPGSNFSSGLSNHHIVPSFEVSWTSNGIQLTNLESQHGIKIGLSSHYTQLLSTDLDPETKAFLEQKKKQADELILNIQRRQENLDTIIRLILNRQSDFIQHGKPFLKPLLQKELKDHVDVSVSTISRILSSKYIRTPYGTMPLKDLCPRNHFGYTKEKLKQIISSTIYKHPTLSDQKITNQLNNQDIPIARRTVTKYRHLLDINRRNQRDADSDSE